MKASYSTDDITFKKWGVWVDRILGELQGMLLMRRVLREFVEICESNPTELSLLIWWIKAVYGQSIMISIRRQTDNDNRVISLYRLLGEMMRNPSVFSREAFLERCLPPKRALARRRRSFQEHKQRVTDFYDEVAGVGQNRLDRHRLKSQRAELSAKAGKVKQFATLAVAHSEVNIPDQISINDIDDVLDMMKRIVSEYRFLLFGDDPLNLLFKGVPPDIEPSVSAELSDWKKAFVRALRSASASTRSTV